MPLKSIILMIFVSSYSLFLLIGNSTSQDKEIEVALRMIGHRVLLASGNENARVLPVQKEGNSYHISFDTDFSFKPNILVHVVDSIVQKTALASNYLVEMQDCNTNETIYSYKIDTNTKEDIIPCGARQQPKTCYVLVFTILDEYSTKLQKTFIEGETNNSKIIGYLLGLVLLGGAIFYVLTVHSKRKDATETHKIQLGDYTFDKQNTTLILNDQRIELTSKEADLLLLLYNAANTTVEREVILNKIWEDQGNYVGRTLDVFISKLRKKLEADQQVKIVNVRGVGYKLVLG